MRRWDQHIATLYEGLCPRPNRSFKTVSFLLLSYLTNILYNIVAVGDDIGFVHVFESQKGELVLVQKSSQCNKEVTHVEVAYGTETNKENDRIYYSSGTAIKAINSKGKEVFKADTYSSETTLSF